MKCLKYGFKILQKKGTNKTACLAVNVMKGHEFCECVITL